MFMAGFTFHLLDNVFTSHWGFQTSATRPSWRAKQIKKNDAKFDKFAKEVHSRYIAGTY